MTEKTNNSDAAPSVSADPWRELKRFTQARIALGRSGTSMPTQEVLDFSLALDADTLEAGINAQGFASVQVHSRAPDRASYLLRPDWGRSLDEASLSALMHYKSAANARKSAAIDFLVVVGDGLSSLAVSRHVQPLLEEIRNALPAEWTTGPVVIVSQARVAIADEIGEALGARIVVMLIGERPGLSSPDSLGIYLTHAPKHGCSDADRNCISNVRPDGLSYAAAAKKLVWLAKQAHRLKVSGVALKDESDIQEIGQATAPSLAK